MFFFTWIAFIELNFTVTFLLIRKIWDDQFASKLGKGIGSFQKWGGGPLEMPLYGLCLIFMFMLVLWGNFIFFFLYLVDNFG